MKDSVRESLIKAFTTGLKVAAYVFISWLISLPVQEAIEEYVGTMISDTTLIILINSLLATITKYLKAYLGDDNIISKIV